MEASLPISAGVSPAVSRQGAVHRPAAVAPSITLPLRFMVTGLLALCTGTIWLVARPGVLATYHYNQSVIAVTHLFVLGWICSVIMGAMYQLVPVALETRLYSERLACWQYAFHVVGFTGMVWMFQAWNMKQVGHFGSVLAIGVGLFAYNIARTLLRVPKWNVVATAITSGLVWISMAVIAGLSIAAAKCSYESAFERSSTAAPGALLHGLRSVAGWVSRFDPIGAMHAHAHLGGVGFFTMLIVGVSYKLIPMFTLSEMQSPRRAGWSVALLNFGLAGSFVTILLRSSWRLAFALVVAAALSLYGWELAAIVHARKRRVLDWGVKYFLTAASLLAPLSVLGVVLSWPGLPLNAFTGQLENVYGFLGLVGVVSFALMGMLYKIIPFLVWFGSYSNFIGRAQVPALADMYSARLQAIGYWTFLAGLFGTIVATLFESAAGVRWGAGVLSLSIVALAANIGGILFHSVRPKLMPLAPKTGTNSIVP